MGSFAQCTQGNQNYSQNAVNSQGIQTSSKDIDDVALQAISNGIEQQNLSLKQSVLLSFQLKDLPNLDAFSKTDAFIILYELKKQGTKTIKQQIGRTECVADNLNPLFVKNFQVDYMFEEVQTFLVEAYDLDNEKDPSNLKEHDYIGQYEFKLHQVVTSIDQTLSAQLVNPSRKKNGSIIITCEEKKNQLNSLTALIQFQGNFLSNNQLFFIVWKKLDQKKFKAVYKSEISKDQKNSQFWNEFSIDTEILCSSDDNQEFKIEFYQSKSNGNHKLLGFVLTKLSDLIQGQRQLFVKNYQVQITKFEKRKSVNFLEYVFGGCEINLSVAIDFTASNGKPTDRDSLHNFDVNKNEYLQALRSIGNILQYYDHDKKIPAYGFGAVIPPINGRASHCFAMNGDIFNPECNGIQGVEQAYHNCINRVQLYGPTKFSEIIHTMNGRCESFEVSNQNQSYQILLILTDGVINDAQQTIDEIVRGSNHPLSIVIVGVGDADFQQMNILDADTTPLYSQKYNKYAQRDIVQFVPFREFRNNAMRLAKETLYEIPSQVVGYFMKRNIFPKPAKEEERQQIAQKLQQKNQFDFNYYIDLYQSEQKQKLIEHCKNMGINPLQVNEFLNTRGLWENQVDTLLDLINNQYFQNPLKIIPQHIQQPMMGGVQVQPQFQGHQQVQQPHINQWNNTVQLMNQQQVYSQNAHQQVNNQQPQYQFEYFDPSQQK